MSKNIEQESKKMTKKRALSCLVAAALVVSSGVVMFNRSEMTPSATVSSGQDVNQKSKVIIDSKKKVFCNIDLAATAAEFDFKVPSYIIENNDVQTIYVNNISSDSKAIKIEYGSDDREKVGNQFDLYAFKGTSPEDTLKSLTNSKEVETKETTLGSIKGKEITFTTTCEDVEKSVITQKIFAWEDNGVWYAIEYNDKMQTPGYEEQMFNDISEIEVQKVAESLVEVSNVDKEKYTTDMIGMHIYTTEDLKYATEKLGFEANLFIDIDEELAIDRADVDELYNKESLEPTGNYILNASYKHNNKGLDLYAEKINDKSSNLKSYTETLVNAQGGKDYEKVEGTDVEAYMYEIGVDGKDETILNYVWNKDGANYRIVIYNGVMDSSDKDLAVKLINAK